MTHLQLQQRGLKNNSNNHNNNNDHHCNNNIKDNLWAAAAAADPSWDRMSGERESRGRSCEHIARLRVGMKWARIDLSWV